MVNYSKRDNRTATPLLTFRYRQRWAPLVSEYVQANAAFGVDVGMIDSGCEVDLGWLEWVIRWEMYGQEEKTVLERTVALDAKFCETLSHLISA
jgi:hypothetical protein